MTTFKVIEPVANRAIKNLFYTLRMSLYLSTYVLNIPNKKKLTNQFWPPALCSTGSTPAIFFKYWKDATTNKIIQVSVLNEKKELHIERE